MKQRHSTHVLPLLALLLSVALMAGCQPVAPTTADDSSAAVATATEAAEDIATETPVAEEAATETPVAEEATPVAEETESPEEATPDAVAEAQPAAMGNPPVAIEIPALSLVIAVTPMGWESTEVDGQTTTRWVVPDDAAGWAPNSARAGDAGNVVFAGHQARGEAGIAPISLGEVEVDQ